MRVVFNESPQNWMGLRTLLSKLMGSAEPIKPMLMRPLQRVHILKGMQVIFCINTLVSFAYVTLMINKHYIHRYVNINYVYPMLQGIQCRYRHF